MPTGTPTLFASRPAGPLSPGPARAWGLTALIATLFCLAVAGVMIYDRFHIAASDPLKSAEMTVLKERLAATPTDEQLKTEIRDLDLRMRRQYFRHLTRNRTGAWLLLAGVVVLVGSATRAAQLGQRPYLPLPRSAAADTAAREATWARWGVGVTGGLAGVGLLALMLTTDTALSSRPAGLAESLPGGPGPETKVASDLPSLAELRHHWPRFRGWDGSGVATSTNVPLQWDVTTGVNVVWKTPVPAPGFNSPIVWSNRVFLAGATPEHREVFCFDADSGQILWQRAVHNVPGSPARMPEVPESTGLAAPTMATDGRRVYVIFGNGDVAAFTIEGALLWSKHLGVPKNAHGHASSLATWEGRLLIQLDQGEGEGLSRFYALDGATGREVWQRPRPVPSSWATPIVIEAAGRAQVITLGAPWVIAYSAADGTELWRAELLEGEVTPSPIFAGGLVLVVSPNFQLAALRPEGRGDVTGTQVAWTVEDTLPDITSPVSNGDLVFTLSTGGTLACYDLKDGRKLWEYDLAMEYHASPTIIGHRLYAISTTGTVAVVEVARQFNELARMDMGEHVSASPAVARDRMFIRGARHLFSIGTKAQTLAKQ